MEFGVCGDNTAAVADFDGAVVLGENGCFILCRKGARGDLDHAG